MQLADGSHMMVSVVGEDGEGNVVVSFDGGETQVSMRREDVQGMVDAARAQRRELMLDNDEGEKVNSTGEAVSPVEGEGVPSAPNAASHKFELNDVVEVRGENGKMVQGYVTRPMNEDGLYEVFTDSSVGGLRSAYYAPEDMRLVEAKGVEGLREGAQEDEDGALQGDEGRDERPSLMDAVRTLYKKGKDAAKQFARTFFDVARTPDFMKGVGLTGDRFTVRYGVLARHFGKDSAHDLPMEVWEQLPDALQKPFAISEYYTDEDKQQQKGYRIYTRLQLADGSHVMVSAEVKNAGRDVEVNAINTVFGRSVISDVHEKLVYVGNELTPEQQALLDGTTPHQYPDARGQDEEGVPSSEGKDSVSSDNGQGNVGENVTEMPMRRVKRKIEGQVMEVDEEDFEAVSPERTQDYLYNEVESGITREQADDFVSAKIAEREKVVKGIEARKPRKGASPAEIRMHKGKVAAELAEALPGLEYWRAVAAARDAVKEREIAAANERYRQERAAKEEAKRAAEVQRKEENGVGAAVRERWLNAPKVEGNADELTLANGEHVGGRYVLVESGAVSASHQAANGFARTEGFPMDENGGAVNDRDYERDGDAQRVTREIAQDYDARALQSPVVVSGDGVVLSGNGRTMAGELAALGGTDGAYVEHLKRYGVKYGFSREQVEKMKHPRVVFVVEEGLPYTAETFAKFNARETKAQSKTEEAVKMGKVVDDGTFGRVLRVLGGFETLGEFYGDEGAVREVVGELANAGVVGRMDMGGLFDGEGVSAQGRELIENVLVGKAFEGDGDAVRRLTEMKLMRTSVVNALGEVLRNKSLGGAFDFMEELPKAVALVYEARKTGGYKVGDAVDGFALQYDMFGEGQTVADPTDVAVLLLANAINDKRNTRLKGVLASYNDLAEDAAMGQGDIFSGFAQNKQSILEDVMRILQLSTPLTTNEHELSQLRDEQRDGEREQETQETDARAAETGVGETGASDEGLEDERVGIGEDSLSAKIAAAEGEVDAEFKKELQDFIAQTDTMGRTAMDESGYDAEELFAPLLLDGKPSPLAVMTSVSDDINDPSVQIAVYDYSQEIDEKTNSGWQKWGNLADEYNAQAAEEDKGWERGDTALLGFRSVDAAVRFYDWVQHRDGVNPKLQVSGESLKSDTEAKQLATDVVLSLLESADVPVEVVSDEVAAAVLPEHAQLHMVYHGSGAKFDKFDHSHMGEGEGAQAYGWGSYVTEVEGIGRTYAKAMLADKYKENRIVNQLVRERLESDGSKEESLKYLKSLLEEGWSDKKRVRKQIKIIETGKYLPEGKVHLYTVEIPDDRGKNYLHWDQSVAGKEKERIRVALTKAVIGRLETSSPSERQALRTSISAEFRHISTGEGVYSMASRYLSPMEASGLLSSLGYTGISHAAQVTAGGRADGARNYVIFKEHDLKITNHVEFMKTSQGTVYGWTVDGKIYLTRAGVNPETPIHEYTHLWAGAMRERNAEGWKSIKDLLQGSPMWEEVMHDPNYSHIKGDEDAVASEVLSRISGKENAKRFEEEAKKVIDETQDLLEKARAVMLLNNVRRAVKQFWNWVGRNLFEIKRFASIEEVTDRVLYDLVNKTNLKTGKGHDKSLIGVDNQGNLVDGEGRLVTEKVGSVDDLRDEDFTSPSRSVELPELDVRVADAIGTGGKPVVIKKNIFERNAKAHGDLTPADSRDILKAALYTPTLYGQNQKTKRPYNWVLIKTRDAEGENRVVLLEVNENKDNVEIVHWHYVRDNALETIKRQAVREGGPILILPSEDSEEAGGLSSRTNNLSSEGKDSESSKKEQGFDGKNGVIRLQKGDDGVAARDAAYADAVARGDMETAERMLAEEAARKGYMMESDYQGTSAFNGAAPSENGYYESLEERKAAFDEEDFEGDWSLADELVHGIEMGSLDFRLSDRELNRADRLRREAIQNLRNVRARVNAGEKDVRITMYRSVPAGVVDGEFRNGDWVTPSRLYAEDNAAVHSGYPGWENGYRIIEQEVPIEHVWWDGNDIAEWGYDNSREEVYKNVANNRKSFSVTYDADGVLIPLSKRFDEGVSDVSYHKGDDVVVSAEDAELRDAVVELMRGAGIDVVVDSEEGQRVLDMENGGVRRAMGERKTFRSGRSIVFTRANPTATLNALERGLKKEGVEVESHKARTGSRYAEFERGGVWYKVRSANHTKALSAGTTLDEVRGMSGIELTMDLKDKERPMYGVEVDLSLNEMGVAGLRALMDEVERFNGSGVDVLSEERVAGFVLPSSYLGDEFPLLSGFLDDEVLRSDEFKGRLKEAQAEVGVVREAYERDTEKPVLDENLHLPFTASNGLKIEHLADGFGRYVSLMPAGSALSHGIGRFGDAKKLRKEAFAEYQAAVAPYEARLMAWEESAPSLEEWLKGNEEMSGRWASAQEVLSRAVGGARLHKVGAEEDAEGVNARFNDELSGLTDANADKVVFSLGRPSGILLSAGVEDRPMKLYGNKVMKKMRKHGFALEELRDLPRAVADPIAVFAGSHDGSHAILTELRMGEKNVLVSLSIGKGGADIDFNIISSVYGKHQDGVVGWLNKGLARYVDKEKALDYLHHAAPIAVTSDNQELSSAAKVVKDFENPKLGVEKRRFFRTEDGKAYGFTVDGKVYLDPKMAGAETAVHEYTHLWADALRRVNPAEWRNVVELMKGTSVWDEVKRGYPELESEDEIADEVLAHYSGRRGAAKLRAALDVEMEGTDGVFERARVVSAFERVKRALARFWKGVADFLGVHFDSADEVADMVLGDLLRGRRLDGEGVSKRERGEYVTPADFAERGDDRYSGAVNVKNLEEKMEVFGWKPREAKTEGMMDLYDVRPVVSTKDYYLGTRADFEMVATDKPAERMYDESEKALSVGDIEAVWEELKEKEGFRLEHSPKSDSEYLVNDATGEIYRKSDHWGRVASCHWMLNGLRREGDWYIGRANVDEFEREKGGYMYSTEESRRERFLLVQAAAENLERALGDGAFKFTAAARREAEKKLAGYRRVLGDGSVEDIVGDVEYGRDMYGRYYAKKSLMGRFHREGERFASMLGRSLSAEEAKELVSMMEENAAPVRELALTRENWAAEFGADGVVQTPLGEVKMGEHQYEKLEQQGRRGKLGMVRPTLESPDVIIEDKSRAKGGEETERGSSYVFVKSFVNEEGKRQYFFTSVTVHRNNQEVVVSNQEKTDKRISNLLQQGEIGWINEKYQPASETQGEEISLSQDNSWTDTSGDKNAVPLGVNLSETSAAKVDKSSENGKGEDIFSMAERIAEETKREQRARRNARYHREGGSMEYGQAVSRAAYEQRMASGAFQSREALQDSMLSLREAMDLILHEGKHGKGWRVEDVSDLENAYMGENRLSSVNSAEQEAFTRGMFKPMLGAVAKLAETEEERMVLTDYLMAKHGLERNRVMAEREGMKAYETYMKKHPESEREMEEFIAKARERDYAGLTALTGVEEVSGAEMEAAKMVEEFEENG